MKKSLPWIVVLLLLLSGLVRDYRSPRVAHAQSNEGTVQPLASGWNISSVSSGSSIFTTNLTTNNSVSIIRIDVTLASTATLAIYETDGTHAFTCVLNGGTALTAGCRYTFVAGMRNSNAGGAGNRSLTQTGAGGATVKTGFTLGSTPYQFNFVVGAPTAVDEIRVDELTSTVD